MQVTHEHLFSISWIKHVIFIELQHRFVLCVIEYLAYNSKSLRLKKNLALVMRSRSSSQVSSDANEFFHPCTPKLCNIISSADPIVSGFYWFLPREAVSSEFVMFPIVYDVFYTLLRRIRFMSNQYLGLVLRRIQVKMVFLLWRFIAHIFVLSDPVSSCFIFNKSEQRTNYSCCGLLQFSSDQCYPYTSR